MVLGCALAAAFALGSALVAVPGLLVLIGPRAREADGEVPGEPRLSRPSRRVGGFLASDRWRAAAALGIATLLMLAAAAPALHGTSRPFAAADLPPGPASAFGDLPPAAGVSAAALALALVGAFRSRRVVPVAVVSMLPAAAACGLCVLVFQDGRLAGTIGQLRQGALETGAVTSMLAAACAVSAGRAVIAIRASRGERPLDLGPIGSAGRVAGFTVPAAIVATSIAAATTGALAGSDLYAAREFGLGVAVGLLIDLALLRAPLIAALARWGGG